MTNNNNDIGSLEKSRRLVSNPQPSDLKFGTCNRYRPHKSYTVPDLSKPNTFRDSNFIWLFSVSPEEFPNAVTVKKKVAEFEKNFVSILAKTFQQLPPLNQLSALSVATRPDRVNQSVSLLQYFESESIPADLGVQNHDSATGNREYYLTISKDRLQEIKKVKMEGLADQKLEVARDILVDMAKEAASELGRMFEYQVALVNESIAMRLLARHAVNCVLYMVKKRNRILDRNSIVIGAVRGRPKVPEGAPKFISVIIGSKELKWNLYEIFKKSALRKELLPNTALVDSCCSASMVGGPEDEAAHCPWKFFTSSESEPMLYGYRSQMVEWDYVNGFFRLNSEEEAVFSEGIFWRYDDFHRVYCPYARLVGFDTVQSYCSGAASCNTTPSVCSGNGNGKDHALVRSISGFTDFVRQSKSGTYIRDEIQLVYRPLGVADFIELDKIDFAGEPVVRYDDGAAVSVGAGGKNPANKALLRSTAMEVTRECDELCHKLKAMDDRARSKCDDDEDVPLSGAEQVNGEQSRCSFFADKLNELTHNCLNDDDPKTITDV